MTHEEAVAVVQMALEGDGISKDQYNDNTKLDALGIDSLEIVSLTMGIEDAYDVDFDSKLLVKIFTVGDMIKAVMDIVPSAIRIQ